MIDRIYQWIASPPRRAAAAGLATRAPLPGGADLAVQRQELECQQRECLAHVQGLMADMRGIVGRYAKAAGPERKAERRLLARLYDTLETRLAYASQRHADVLQLLKLLDRACALQEDREMRLAMGLAAGSSTDLGSLRTALGEGAARLSARRQHVQDLLDDLDGLDADSRLELDAELALLESRLDSLAGASPGDDLAADRETAECVGGIEADATLPPMPTGLAANQDPPLRPTP